MSVCFHRIIKLADILSFLYSTNESLDQRNVLLRNIFFGIAEGKNTTFAAKSNTLKNE